MAIINDTGDKHFFACKSYVSIKSLIYNKIVYFVLALNILKFYYVLDLLPFQVFFLVYGTLS